MLRVLWAHPRSRGENESVAYGIPPMLGASPLTRGKPRTGATLDGIGGRIPAHAGKTQAVAAERASTTAHPRSRGENVRPKPASAYLEGASPLTRGKLGGSLMPWQRHGRIPAHAGKT